MSSEDFNTKDYLIDLRNTISALNKEFFEDLDTGDDVKKLLRICEDSLELSLTYFIKHLRKMNENPFWGGFFNDWRPSFNNDELIQDLFLTLSLTEVILKQVNLEGIYNTKMSLFAENIDLAKELFREDPYAKKKYEKCKIDYDSLVIFSILKWGILRDFETNNAVNVSTALNDLTEEKKALDEDFSSRFEKLDNNVQEIEKQITAMSEKAGFLSLYAGFDKYAGVIKNKLFWLNMEKGVWALSIGGAIAFSIYLNNSMHLDWVSLIPFGGLILFCSTLLRVNLKKIDQYEQIMSKVEHKLAVSTFYQSEIKDMAEGKEKEAVNEEYYKFLFSNIETTEWNTPDIASDIAKILKSYKS